MIFVRMHKKFNADIYFQISFDSDWPTEFDETTDSSADEKTTDEKKTLFTVGGYYGCLISKIKCVCAWIGMQCKRCSTNAIDR